MTKKAAVVSAAVVAALIAGFGATGGSDDDHRGRRQRRLKADLRGFNEVMTVSSAARGSFRATLSRDEDSIEYRLRFWGLEGNVTQAHIHLGDHHTTGGISVWLCETATNPSPSVETPECGGPTSGDVSGTLTPEQVIGPSGQGIAAGEFEELVRAIKGGVTYVNVHSSKFGGGEVRGEIKVDD
jgi:hypothetical protein